MRREVEVVHGGKKVDALRLRVAAFDVPLIWPLRSGDEVEVTITARVEAVQHNTYRFGASHRVHTARIVKSEIISRLGESLDNFLMPITDDADDDRLKAFRPDA